MEQTETEKPRPSGREMTPEMQREVSRRNLIRDELGRASLEAIKQFPGFGGVLGFAFKESAAQRDDRLVRHLWLLLMGREPKPDEASAGLELMRNSQTPDEKGDALVDITWALCQTRDFEALSRPPATLIRGLYFVAFDREPREDELKAALELFEEAQEPGARSAVIEGLLTGLVRSADCVLRKAAQRPDPVNHLIRFRKQQGR
jgi:hypothetical protein